MRWTLAFSSLHYHAGFMIGCKGDLHSLYTSMTWSWHTILGTDVMYAYKANAIAITNELQFSMGRMQVEARGVNSTSHPQPA